MIALTYQLEKQIVGTTDHLKTEPIASKTVYSATKPDDLKNHGGIAGFYIPKKNDLVQEEEENEDPVEIVEQEIDEEPVKSDSESDVSSEDETEENTNQQIHDEELAKKFASLGFNTVENKAAESVLQTVETEESNSDPEQSDEDQQESEEEDEGGWITPANISNVKKNFGLSEAEEKNVEVGCITTDFAMQNVLKQIGLQVTTLDGRIIKHMRTFILRCYTCYKTTPDTTRIFCKKCGHKTLKRVAISINDKGEQVIHINARKPLTAKFKNQPLPAPKGGKHACNPILFEDQRLPQQRISKKAQMTTNALDDDYIANYSPFVMRDVDSRSAMMRNTANIKQWMNNYEYDNHRRGYKKYKK